jgi:hypothetical protein
LADLKPDRHLTVAGLAVGLAVGLVALALVRIALGWAPLAPDDARYLFVGLSVLDGQGAITPSGAPYLLRSPVYGVALALGSQLLGGDPLDGARVVAVTISLLGLLGAVRIAWLAAGPGGAVGTAIALVATPLIWQLVPSLRIDLTQTALVVALLLAAWRPTTRRWAAAGVLLGLVVLVKETALPLAFLPLSLVGLVPGPPARRLALAYLGAALATAGWWWIVVWVSIGRVFPANALAVIEARDVEGALRLPWTAVPLLATFVAAWAVVAWRARRELGSRLILAAAIGLAPAALYAASQGLNARNFAGVAVLSAIAVGIAGATLVAVARPRLARGSATDSTTRAIAALTLAGIVAFALTGPVLGQRAVRRPAPDRLTTELVTWVGQHVEDGGRIVMAFREREETALRRFGRTDVRLLGVRRVDPAAPPDAYIWMGLRGRQLFGYPRTVWVDALTDPPATYLVLVGPHPFTPTDLLGTGGEGAPGEPPLPGLTPVETLDDGRDHADIFRIDAEQVRAGTAGVPLHLAADAALVWLDQDGGSDRPDRLLQARPVITGDDVATLLARLGERACRLPGAAGTTRLAPAEACSAP